MTTSAAGEIEVGRDPAADQCPVDPCSRLGHPPHQLVTGDTWKETGVVREVAVHAVEDGEPDPARFDGDPDLARTGRPGRYVLPSQWAAPLVNAVSGQIVSLDLADPISCRIVR